MSEMELCLQAVGIKSEGLWKSNHQTKWTIWSSEGQRAHHRTKTEVKIMDWTKDWKEWQQRKDGKHKCILLS